MKVKLASYTKVERLPPSFQLEGAFKHCLTSTLCEIKGLKKKCIVDVKRKQPSKSLLKKRASSGSSR